MKRLLALILSTVCASCLDIEASVSGAPCPCAQSLGFVCCNPQNIPGGGVCIKDGAFCEQTPPAALELASVTPTIATAGTELTIHGAGFREGPLEVTIGSRPCASQARLDDQRIRCEAPFGGTNAATVDVVVQLGEEVAALKGAVRYILPPFTDDGAFGDIDVVGTQGTGLTIFDWNSDGRLDLLFTRSADEDRGAPGPVFGPTGARPIFTRA